SSLAAALDGSDSRVASVDEKPYRRSPAAPFITSTLQQESARKLRFSAQRTMQTAQRLYEQGYITYMRTDSTTLSETALAAARSQAQELYGPGAVPDRPRTYDRRVKNAQEAHEAIRPSGERFRTPSQLGSELRGDELRLYELVWQRTVASQMIDATGVTARVRIAAATRSESSVVPAGTPVEYAASGTVITSPGFLRVYREDFDEEDGRERQDGDVRLPPLAVGEELTLTDSTAEGHATKPPARFTEASLVKRLEELGVGRPSTYAGILQTVQDRGYVWRKGSALVPSFTAFAVVGLLEEHFAALVDYGFTASMEDDLDEIAGGSEEVVPWLERFYFGRTEATGTSPEPRPSTSANVPDRDGAAVRIRIGVDGEHGLKEAVSERLDRIDAREVNSIPLGADSNGELVVVRVGRYGPYLQRGEERASVPDGLAPDELTLERAEELLSAPSGDRPLGNDPETGLPVLARAGRFGPYVQLGEAVQGGEKPRTASLFKSMQLDAVTLEQALELLRLPRVLGADPSTGEEVVARNGRYGPYVQRGSESRSLEREEQLLEVTLEEALALIAQPKERRFSRAAAAPLKEVGVDPASGQPIVLREGRFGPYVTDGTVNASLRKSDDPEQLSLERAAELLADKRAAGPSTGRRGAKKAGAKKSPAKKAAVKKAGDKKAAPAKKTVAKKSPAKKTVAKKSPAKKAVAKKAGAKKSASGNAEGAGAPPA
ncbi:MAG: topoisomerase, partial [Acidimicrobiaceae bacterium]|nr:topoisomerase [Acidimicrobiaceae bacterium]